MTRDAPCNQIKLIGAAYWLVDQQVSCWEVCFKVRRRHPSPSESFSNSFHSCFIWRERETKRMTPASYPIPRSQLTWTQSPRWKWTGYPSDIATRALSNRCQWWSRTRFQSEVAFTDECMNHVRWLFDLKWTSILINSNDQRCDVRDRCIWMPSIIWSASSIQIRAVRGAHLPVSGERSRSISDRWRRAR